MYHNSLSINLNTKNVIYFEHEFIEIKIINRLHQISIQYCKKKNRHFFCPKLFNKNVRDQ